MHHPVLLAPHLVQHAHPQQFVNLVRLLTISYSTIVCLHVLNNILLSQQMESVNNVLTQTVKIAHHRITVNNACSHTFCI